MSVNTSDINHVVAVYEPYFERILKTGSRVICSPTPDKPNTDEDYLLLIDPKKLEDFEKKLGEDDWYFGGSLGISNDVLHETHTVLKDGTLSNNNLFHSFKRQEDPGIWNDDIDDFSVQPSGVMLNLLVTINKDYFEDFTRATYLAKALNLQSKHDRVILFEALTRDSWPDPNKKKEYGKTTRVRLPNTFTVGESFTYTIPDVVWHTINPPVASNE